MVSSIDGVSRCGEFGLYDIFISGLLLIIVYILDINVVSFLCVKFFFCFCKNMVFNICFIVLISFFYILFMCGVCGGLNF